MHNFTGSISLTLKLRAKMGTQKGQNNKEVENFANKVLAVCLCTGAASLTQIRTLVVEKLVGFVKDFLF